MRNWPSSHVFQFSHLILSACYEGSPRADQKYIKMRLDLDAGSALFACQSTRRRQCWWLDCLPASSVAACFSDLTPQTGSWWFSFSNCRFQGGKLIAGLFGRQFDVRAWLLSYKAPPFWLCTFRFHACEYPLKKSWQPFPRRTRRTLLSATNIFADGKTPAKASHCFASDGLLFSKSWNIAVSRSNSQFRLYLIEEVSIAFMEKHPDNLL